MRKIRYLTLLMLAMLCCVAAVAQDGFDPASPGEPGVPPQRLFLQVMPAGSGSVSGAGKHVPESQVSVTATPNTGWQFVNWTDEDGNVLSTASSYKHTKLDRPETLTAHFEFNPDAPTDPVPSTQQVYYTLTAKAGEGGTVSGGGKYQAGTSVGLSASCHTGWVFAGWVDEDGETISASASLAYTTKACNETLTAVFRFNPGGPDEPGAPILRHHVWVTATDGGTAYQTTYALQGTAVSLRANANTGYDFVGWYMNGEYYTPLSSFSYTIGAADVSFEARFLFNPDSPNEPNMPLDNRYSLYWISPITYPGKDVECSLFLSNLAPLGDMRFDLTFPEGLAPDMQDIQLSEAMEGYTPSIAGTDSPGTYTVTLHGGTIGAGNQEIARFHVPVPESTEPNIDHQLKINQVSVAQEDGTTCTMRTRNGRISVYKKGDTNGDGEVNILDRINLVGIVATETINEDTFIKEVSDINEDGEFSILDVIGISDIIAQE